MSELIVNVTQEDIDKAIPGSGNTCPIALALARALGAETAYAARCALACDEFSDLFVSTPQSAIEFINAYDRGIKVAPFSFAVDWPHQATGAPS